MRSYSRSSSSSVAARMIRSRRATWDGVRAGEPTSCALRRRRGRRAPAAARCSGSRAARRAAGGSPRPSGRTARPAARARRGRSRRASPRCSPRIVAQLVLGEVVHDLAQVLAGEGTGALVVRVVAAPHEAVRRRSMWRAAHVGRAGEARADPHVLLEVLGRRARQRGALGVLELADRALAHAGDDRRRAASSSGDELRRAGLGDHELEPREALEHAAEAACARTVRMP